MAAKIKSHHGPKHIPNICDYRDPPHFSLVPIFKVQTQPRDARGLQRMFRDSFPARTIHLKTKPNLGPQVGYSILFGIAPARTIHLNTNLNLGLHVG
jgi:hypothetical protein